MQLYNARYGAKRMHKFAKKTVSKKNGATVYMYIDSDSIHKLKIGQMGFF